MRELPQELQDELYDALNRGVEILDSEPLMMAYQYSFGKMHQAKLNYAYSQLPIEFIECDVIDIVDYGCGQALGTICYADYLHSIAYPQQVKTITLIEPSEVCLKRAALHASVFFPEAEIKTINKKFDNLVQSDIVCSESTPTLHIMSNVLDMSCFDHKRFTHLIKDCIKGQYQFVCVGPYFSDNRKNKRISNFVNEFNHGFYFSKTFNRGELEEDKDWTGVIQCFSSANFEDQTGMGLLSSGNCKAYFNYLINKVQHFEQVREKFPNNALLCHSTAKAYQDFATSFGVILKQTIDKQSIEKQNVSLFGKAVQLYLKAISLNPHFCHSYCNLGEILFDLGDVNGALYLFEQGIINRPKCSKGWARLGKAYLELNNDEKAKSCYQKAIEFDPFNDDAIQALERIKH